VTTPRLYLPQALQEGGLYRLDQGHRRYLSNVLRLRSGDAVTLFDGSGWDFPGRLERSADGEIAVRIVGRTEVDAAPACRITLAQALPKGVKMDTIVAKATEIGVVKLIPFYSARSVPRWEETRAAARVARWEKIAVEAARRCRRRDVPTVTPVAAFAEILAPPPGEQGERLIFWEEGGRSIKDILREGGASPPRDYFLVVGPEGGLTPEEVAAAREAGFTVASLGRHILRVETASLVILTILQYERGIFAGES